MEPFSVPGAFHLPGSERAVRGEFAFDGSSSRISLGDSLVQYLTPLGQALPYEDNDTVEHAVIHGELDSGELVTMLHCRGSQRMALNSFESWRCAIALVGGQAEADAFTRVSLQFDCLNAWAEPPPVVNDVRIGDDVGDVLDTARHELERATIGNAVVTLVAHVKGRWGGDVVDLHRRCSLVIEMQPSGFGHLAEEWIQPLHELLILLLGRSVRLTQVFVKPTSATRRDTFEALYTPVQVPSEEEPRREALLSWGHPTSYLRTELPITFQALIGGWIPLRQQNREAVSLLCGPHLAPFMYLEHRYSSLFQSAEHIARGFGGKELTTADHRVRVKAIVDAAAAQGVPDETVEWARRVLQPRNDRTLSGAIEELVRRAGPVGAEILERSPSFSNIAASARADVSHPSADGAPTETFYWSGEALTWVVRVYLLGALGVNLDELHEHIVRRGHFPQVLDGIAADQSQRDVAQR